jgi:hypothetical protein
MAYHDKTQLTLIIIAPADQVAEGDRLFRSHGAWMESTHHRSGEKALLSYNVSKGTELSDPMDLNSAPHTRRPKTNWSRRAQRAGALLFLDPNRNIVEINGAP